MMEEQEKLIREVLQKAVTVVNDIEERYRETAFPFVLQSLMSDAHSPSLSAEVDTLHTMPTLSLSPTMSINEFFRKAGPDSHPGRFTCAAYYLLHESKIERFNQADILGLYEKLRIPKPKNPPDVLNQCIRKVHIVDGPLTSDKQKNWVITPDGEKYVEELLRGNTNGS